MCGKASACGDGVGCLIWASSPAAHRQVGLSYKFSRLDHSRHRPQIGLRRSANSRRRRGSGRGEASSNPAGRALVRVGLLGWDNVCMHGLLREQRALDINHAVQPYYPYRSAPRNVVCCSPTVPQRRKFVRCGFDAGWAACYKCDLLETNLDVTIVVP
eukprot:365788-Chlamydomonas_euryale.AAC.7